MKTENLPLVKTIRASDKLSPQKKTAVIKKIDRIFKSRDEKKKCEFNRSSSYIYSAFIWRHTKEGVSYWDEVDDILNG